MNDLKNVVLAWASSSAAVLSAVETQTLISIFSAIVLPMIFFAAGKAVDVALQLYIRRRAGTAAAKEERDE